MNSFSERFPRRKTSVLRSFCNHKRRSWFDSDRIRQSEALYYRVRNSVVRPSRTEFGVIDFAGIENKRTWNNNNWTHLACRPPIVFSDDPSVLPLPGNPLVGLSIVIVHRFPITVGKYKFSTLIPSDLNTDWTYNYGLTRHTKQLTLKFVGSSISISLDSNVISSQDQYSSITVSPAHAFCLSIYTTSLFVPIVQHPILTIISSFTLSLSQSWN